jgi:hypothetical protein
MYAQQRIEPSNSRKRHNNIKYNSYLFTTTALFRHGSNGKVGT